MILINTKYIVSLFEDININIILYKLNQSNLRKNDLFKSKKYSFWTDGVDEHNMDMYNRMQCHKGIDSQKRQKVTKG